MENQGLDNVEEVMNTKKLFSRIGLTLFIMVLVIFAIQSSFVQMVNTIAPQLWEQTWMTWAPTVIGLYITAFPIYCILMKKIPNAPKGEPKQMKIDNLVTIFFICMATMYIFNIFSGILIYVIGLIKGGSVNNPLGVVLSSSSWLYTLIVAGIIAPIVEEVIFRGILLDKIRAYGDKTAIWVTALTFGLFHQNLSQFFYATALGIILAYVAVRTNRIKYSIILHIGINILGSVVMPILVTSKNPILAVVAGLILIIMLAVGIILFVKEKKYVVLDEGTQPIDKAVRKRTIYGNVGMLFYIGICLVFMVLTTMA